MRYRILSLFAALASACSAYATPMISINTGTGAVNVPVTKDGSDAGSNDLFPIWPNTIRVNSPSVVNAYATLSTTTVQFTLSSGIYLQINMGTPTANRVITAPDLSGTIIVDAGAQNVGGVKTFTTGGGAVVATGASLTANSGSTATFNGALAGTPTGGALDLHNLTLTMPTFADPSWITSLAASKVGLGNVSNATTGNGTMPIGNGSLTMTGAGQITAFTAPTNLVDLGSAQNISAVKTYTTGGGITLNSGATLTASSGSTVALNGTLTINGQSLGSLAFLSGLTATISVASETAKLARSGDMVGQLVEVNYNGNGRSVWRYEGGGESSSGNWSLQSDIDVWRSTADTTSLTSAVNGTTLTDDAQLQVDYVPPGVYDCEVSFGGFVDAGGLSWCVATNGSMVSKPPGVTVWSNALSDSGFVLGDIFSAHSRTFGGSTDHWWSKETIVVTSGNLRVQFAQYSSNAADTNISAGARLHLHRVGN